MNQLKEIYRSVFVQKAIKGTLWLSLGSVIFKGMVVFAYVILARILSVSEYGEYGMIKATIDNFLIFATLGVGITVTKYVSELKVDNPKLASNIIGAALLSVLVLSVLVFVGILLFSNTMAASLLKNQNLATPLMLAGGILLFVAVSTVIQGALLGVQRYRHIFIINAIQGLLMLVGLCVGGYYFGVLGAVAGNLLAIIIMTLAALFLLQHGLKGVGLSISFANFNTSIRTIAKFAIPASLAMLVGAPAIWLLNAQLASMPDGYQQLGIYSAVLIFSLALRTLNTAISNAVLPLFLDKEVILTGRKQFFNYHGAWLICLTVSLPMLLVPELGSWILGPQYPVREVTIILSLTLLSTLCFSFKQGISRDLIKQNKMWYSALSMLLWAIVVFIVFWYTKHLGAIGFAIAFCSGYLANVMIVVPFYIYKKFTPKYAFLSPWLFLLVSLILILIITNLFSENVLTRVSASILLVAGIGYAVTKLYQNMAHLKIA